MHRAEVLVGEDNDHHFAVPADFLLKFGNLVAHTDVLDIHAVFQAAVCHLVQQGVHAVGDVLPFGLSAAIARIRKIYWPALVDTFVLLLCVLHQIVGVRLFVILVVEYDSVKFDLGTHY